MLLSFSSWQRSSLYPGAHRRRPVQHEVSISRLKKGREEAPWQGYHHFPKPPAPPPGACSVEVKSSCKNPNTGVTRGCKTPRRIDYCAPGGFTHCDAKSMALQYFQVLTLASPFISWHKLEEFAAVPVDRAVTSQGKQFKFNYNNISCYIILSYQNIVLYRIILFYVQGTQGKAKCAMLYIAFDKTHHTSPVAASRAQSQSCSTGQQAQVFRE